MPKPKPQRHRLSLVERAIAKQQAAKAFADYQALISTTRLKVMMHDHGTPATSLLSLLCTCLGTQCEAGVRQYGRDPAWVRQLHGALRSIRAMCLDDYRWDAGQAQALDVALELASTLHDFDATIFLESFLTAESVAVAIEQRRFTADMLR